MSQRLPLSVAVLSVLLAGCPREVTAVDGGIPAGGCPAGQRAAADSTHCQPLLPAEDCPAGTMPLLGQESCEPIGWRACPAGFEADPSGWGCREVLPDLPCAAGTMAALGQRTCQKVGWTVCPAGFEADPSGWGCRDVLPKASCAGATRAVLGQTSCQSAGSCTGTFPPADATHFVNAAFTAGELDATHFLTLTAAVAVAPRLSVIAVYPGTYAEGVNLARPVTIVGRCAAQVNLNVPAATDTGIAVSGFTGTVVRGLTITGGRPGLAAVAGGSLTFEDGVLEGSRELGAYTDGAGSLLTLVRSVVRNTQVASDGRYGYGADVETGAKLVLEDSELFANHTVGAFVQNPGSKMTVTRSVVHGTLPGGQGAGHGIQVEGSATALTVEQSAIFDNRILGVYATGAGAQVQLTDSVVRDTQVEAIDQLAGVHIEGGAHLVMRRCALVANRDMGLFVKEPNSAAEVYDSVIRDTQPRGAAAGRGVSLQETASVTLDHTAVVGNREYGVAVGGAGTRLKLVGSLVQGTKRVSGGVGGWGVLAMDAAQLTVEDSALEGNLEYGLSVAKGGTRATVTGTVVRGTERSALVLPTGKDYRVQGIGVQEGAELNLDRSALIGNRQIGLYLFGADAEGVPNRVNASNVVVRDTRGADAVSGGDGSGVVVGAYSRLGLSSSALVGNVSVGLLVTELESAAYVTDTVIRDTKANADGDLGRGANVQSGGELQLERSALVDNRDMALLVSEAGSQCRANQVLLQDTQASIWGSGRGIGVQFGAHLDFTHSTLRNSTEVAVHVLGAGSVANISDSWVSGTAVRAADGQAGHGIVADGDSKLVLERSQVDSSAGIGVVVAVSAAVVSSSFIYRNTVGLHAQTGSNLVVTPGAPAVTVPLEVQVTEDTQFFDNGTRIGSGSVPLPSPAQTYQR